MKLFNNIEILEKKVVRKSESERLHELTNIILKNFGKKTLCRARPNFVSSKGTFIYLKNLNIKKKFL